MASIFQTTPVNSVFNSPTPGKITLMAGHPVIEGQPIHDSLCVQLKDCGFNALASQLDEGNINLSLENCAAAQDLSLFIRLDENLAVNSVKNIISRYKDREGLGGWMFSLNLPSSAATLNSLEARYKDLISADPTHPFFVGVSGDWLKDSDNANIGGYPDYIAQVQQKFQPSFWPFMYFPYLTPPDTSVPAGTARLATFFKDLQYFAYISRYTARPFWSVCRSQSFNDYKGYYAPELNLSFMRQVVFASLAYGAQGIYYWNYCEDSKYSKIGKAPLTYNGLKTSIWNNVKTVNTQVKAFNDIFAGSELIECRHFTTYDVTEWVGLFEYPIGPLMRITRGDETSPYGLLISHLNNKGKDYLVVLCYYDEYSSPNLRWPNQTFTLHFNRYWNVQQIKQSGDSHTAADLEDFDAQFNLAPGVMLVFSWE